MTLLKSKETPLIGRRTKHPMHIEIREAKTVGVEHEAAEEEYQQNENEQRRPSIRTRMALPVEDV
ncbi:hypothetical protein BFJ70_g17811 [Fusarium oxysporum]|nr:hypothetical protein BFJ70_g17811 [Fusarium oxysporum]